MTHSHSGFPVVVYKTIVGGLRARYDIRLAGCRVELDEYLADGWRETWDEENEAATFRRKVREAHRQCVAETTLQVLTEEIRKQEEEEQ